MVDIAMRMTFTEYASHMGTSRQYVSKIFKQGRLKKALVTDEFGKLYINSEIADRLLRGQEDDVIKLFEEPIVPVSRDEVTSMSAEDFDTNIDDETILKSSYDESKRIKTCMEAIEAKIRIEEKRKTLLSAEEVEKDAERFGLLLRDKLMLIPSRIADDLSGKTSIFDIKNIISNAINEVLEEVSSL